MQSVYRVPETHPLLHLLLLQQHVDVASLDGG